MGRDDLGNEMMRRALDERKKRARPFKLKLVTFHGGGLQPGVVWDLPRDLAYELPFLHDK